MVTERALDVTETVARASNWPGVRTLHSRVFRILLASSLLVIGIVLLGQLLAEQAANPEGQYAFDFQTYHAAAGALAAGRSPYQPWMLVEPIPAQGAGAAVYKYPPVLGHLLVPLVGLPVSYAAAIWVVTQIMLILAGMWLALRAGGARHNIETVLWCAVAATYFLPNFDTVWKGNVSGVQAFQVGLLALGGAAAGGAAASAALLKTTPVVVLLPALFASRRMAVGLLGVGLAVLGVSFAISPQAWLDFFRIVPNLIAGDTAFPFNLAPDAMVALALPDAQAAATVIRLIVVALGVAALVLSLMVVRRPGGWPAAMTLAVTAMLLLPSSIWYHYLAVLLPIAAFAWWRASGAGRIALVLGAALISTAVVWLPLALLGSAVLVTAALRTLWPPARQARQSVLSS